MQQNAPLSSETAVFFAHRARAVKEVVSRQSFRGVKYNSQSRIKPFTS